MMAAFWMMALAGGVAADPAPGTSAAVPAALQGVGIEQRLDQQVPLDLMFRDENGNPAALRECFNGKPVILALVYYQCPMLCNEVIDGLLKSLRTMSLEAGTDFEVAAVSFNPVEPPALAGEKKARTVRIYGRKNGAAGWHFLTGEPASIERLTQAVGFHYKYNPETQQFAHAGGIMVLTPSGKLSRYFYGIDFPPRDLRLGLVEASHNRIGSLADQLLLFCFHYDPENGRYGLAIFGILRLLGVLFVGALAAAIWRMLRSGAGGKPAPRVAAFAPQAGGKAPVT